MSQPVLTCTRCLQASGNVSTWNGRRRHFCNQVVGNCCNTTNKHDIVLNCVSVFTTELMATASLYRGLWRNYYLEITWFFTTKRQEQKLVLTRDFPISYQQDWTLWMCYENLNSWINHTRNEYIDCCNPRYGTQNRLHKYRPGCNDVTTKKCEKNSCWLQNIDFV